MEELNKDTSNPSEENVGGTMIQETWKSCLLIKVRQNFAVFGGISFLFGILLALFFYKAGIGINVFLFTLGTVILLILVNLELGVCIKTDTKIYFIGAMLMGLSTFLTASEILQFLNVIGIMMLLDLSLLNQFYQEKEWSFAKYLLRMIGLIFESIACIGMPFVDFANYLKDTRLFKNDKVRNIFFGMVLTVPIIWLVITLLSSADLLFRKLTERILDHIFSTDIFGILFMILIGTLSCYAILCGSILKVGRTEKRTFKKVSADVAVTVMTILCLIYAVFCTIQVIYLFANGLFILPEQYSFAEYARRGFFELLTVTIINIAMMILCRELFQESKILRLLITLTTVCTYVMIVSATYRMLLYIGAYHLTFLRVFVLLSLLIIALVLAGVIISEYRKNFPLFRYSVMIVMICYLIFSFSKPDYYIAAYTTEHNKSLDREDISYLVYDLSLDAAPIILAMIADEDIIHSVESSRDDTNQIMNDTVSLKQDYARGYQDRIRYAADNREIRDFNYSVYQANKKAVKYRKIRNNN